MRAISDRLASTAQRILEVDSIDFGTCHYYPHFADTKDPIAFGRKWVHQRIEAGHGAGKPMIVEEYGWPLNPSNGANDAALRKVAFEAWLTQVQKSRGAGALLWMIAATSTNGQPYPDYDRYTIYSGEDTGFAPARIF